MKTILRTQQIYIDLPTPGAEPWINLIIQRVEVSDDYQQVHNTVDRWGQVSARMGAIAMRTYPLVDPVHPPAGTISAAGIAEALTLAAIDLIIEKYGGALDSATGLIVVD